MKILLETFPVSTNNMYFGRRIMTPAARTKKEAIGWEANMQFHGEPLEGPLFVAVTFYYPNKRNHDIDNIKGLLDALTGIVWKDDGQIEQLMLTKQVDVNDPRIEMEITQI